MPITVTDRLAGLSTSVAIKPPCRVATISNVPLVGLFTHAGVALQEGDRVLVMAQTAPSENGIRIASAGPWVRAKDFDGARDVVQGTIVLVRPASSDTLFYEVTSPNPIVVGTSDITFAAADPGMLAVRDEFADDATLALGDAMLGVRHPATGGAARTQHEKNQDLPTTADFATIANGNTAAPKGVLRFTAGAYSIAPMTLGRVSWSGLGWTTDPAIDPGATLRKTSNGVHVVMGGDDSYIENIGLDGRKSASITGDGLQLAATRQHLQNVSVVNQGADGIRIGGVGATGVFNANLWSAIRPISLSNTGDGCYIHHEGGDTSVPFPAPYGAPDVNAGVMLGSDFRNNGSIGLEVRNAIDNLFLGVVAQTNTGKGVVLRPQARGQFFLKTYSELNNGGGGLPGDEVDVELGAEQNAFIGLRFQSAGGQSGFRDVNAPGKNLALFYEDGLGSWVYRSKFVLWNPRQDASSTTVEMDAHLGANAAKVFQFIGSGFGTSGGQLTILGKLDGGAMVPSAQTGTLGQWRTLLAHVQKLQQPAYSASISFDASTGNFVEITANNGTAFTINDPTNPSTGQVLTYTIRNTSGGALGAVTWGSSFKLAAWTSPATTTSRSISFRYNGANWVEISRTPADVPN